MQYAGYYLKSLLRQWSECMLGFLCYVKEKAKKSKMTLSLHLHSVPIVFSITACRIKEHLQVASWFSGCMSAGLCCQPQSMHAVQGG